MTNEQLYKEFQEHRKHTGQHVDDIIKILEKLSRWKVALFVFQLITFGVACLALWRTF